MLLVVSIAWLVLTAPYVVFTIFVRTMSRNDPPTYATKRLVKLFCFLLMYINHSINFLLYCLTGRKFRAELKEMLVAVCPRPATRWVSTSPSMRTTRSNCVELEPLNDSAKNAGTHHSTARRQFYVGDPANEVVVVAHDVKDDVIV